MKYTAIPGYMRRSGFLQGMFILVALVAGFAGWAWLMDVTVDEVRVAGNHVADVRDIRELAGVDSGDVMFDISPRLVSDRVSRHAWVARAGVTRLPTGVLIIRIAERAPVLQILSPDGRPDSYLDAEGHLMPRSRDVAYDVPLLSGFDHREPRDSSVTDPMLIEFLGAIGEAGDDAGMLISEVMLEAEEVRLRLEPWEAAAATPVRLGKSGFREKLDRLSAFWDQRILPHPENRFELIDLRFSSQIIAREIAGVSSGDPADKPVKTRYE